MSAPRFANVRIVVNPASGPNRAILGPLNDVLHPAGVHWDVSVTNGPGEGTELARQAVADGVDVVGVYGGNGTVAEVAAGLEDSRLPLWILPGGTGNGTVGELGLPGTVKGAAELLVDRAARVGTIDLGRIGDSVFVLRAGIGAIADVDRRASRELKDRVGGLAYVSAGLDVLRSTKPSRYRLTVDGEVIEQDAAACIVANGAGFGGGFGVLWEDVSMTDGLFDVFLYSPDELRTSMSRLRENPGLAASRSLPTPPVASGRHIRVESETPQPAVADGEEAGETPLEIEVLPLRLNVLLPPLSAKGTPPPWPPHPPLGSGDRG